MTDLPTWAELTMLMTHGPDLAVRGRIRHDDGGEPTYHAWAGDPDDPDPVHAHRAGPNLAVWRVDDRLRLEDAEGRAALISDGRTVWIFPEPGGTPLEQPPGHVLYEVGATALLVRPDPDRWRGDDFTRPAGPVSRTTYLGRPAWTVELAPPTHKPHPLQLVVDAETGLLLQQRNDGLGIVTEWTELVVGEELGPDLFTWDGPVVTWEAQRSERRREREAEDRELTERTRRHLGLTSVVVPLRVTVEIHAHEPDGSLHGGIAEVGSLHRRPLDDGPWAQVQPDAHRWSDTRWDWALEVWDHVTLADGALASVEQQLSDAEGDRR